MKHSDLRSQAAFAMAVGHIKTTVGTSAEEVSQHLSLMASATRRAIEREALLNAQLEFHRNLANYVTVFADNFEQQVNREIQPHGTTKPSSASEDWRSLSLVGDDEIEEKILADRICRTIAHGCEAELRELASYSGVLLGLENPDPGHNPIRPELIGTSMYRAINAATQDPECRKLLAQELSVDMARVLPNCYATILKDFRARGLQPMDLTIRSSAKAGHQLERDHPQTISDGVAHDYEDSSHHHDEAPTTQRQAIETQSGHKSEYGTSQFNTANDALRTNHHGKARQYGQGGSSNVRTDGAPNRQSPSSQSSDATPAEAELTSLLRRLTTLTLPAIQTFGPDAAVPQPIDTDRANFTGTLPTDVAGHGQVGPGLMAPNLIRAHREALRQMSKGALDHNVIDLVEGLFDQVLSDPRVSPQMARLLGRLQLPVLRVALSDASFFSSHDHPVRLLVNRIATLGCGFESFDDGPGLEFLLRVSELVQDIVEGDFDQIHVYSAKLIALENFIAQQAKDVVQTNASAASMVDAKEFDLRLQYRYAQQLHTALAPLAAPQYLSDFLSQVWSQVLAKVAREQGPKSPTLQKFKDVGRDLILSVRPKDSQATRKKFLIKLPELMKELHDGLRLISWPDESQQELFGQLMAAYAESLKSQPLTELTYNLLAKDLEAIFNKPLPDPSTLQPDAPVAHTTANLETQFSPDEARQIGLLEEKAVNWSMPVDINLAELPEDDGATTVPMKLDQGVDIQIDTPGPPSAEPTIGSQIVENARVGVSYQMHLQDHWQTVRLSYVSPGHTFFVFTHGKRHQETLSVTSRMLSRMCETHRLRPLEKSQLLERATARARKQLAALTTCRI